jgi:hypothetical protein
VTIVPADHGAAVAAALEAIDVTGRAGYRWMGDPFEVPAEVVRHADSEALRGALIDGIRWRLYTCFFTRGEPRPARRASRSPGARRALSEELAAANSGIGCLDPGWAYVGREDDRHVVERGSLRLWVGADEIDLTGVRQPTPGDLVSIRLPPDVPEFSPGFYMALGDRGFSAGFPRLLDRFYLNLRRPGAVEFVRQVTRRLNRAGLAFRAKVADEPEDFERCDSALLVFERRDRERGLAAALDLHSVLSRHLDPQTPALTHPIAPGLAFAEDPGPEGSFGAQRCLLVAEAVVTAHERGVHDVAGRLDVVRERFADAGTSIEAPYLGPDSTGDLEAPVDAIALGRV